ncbi:MAG: hypothetical protein ABIF87_08910 [Pseudomonadota bacterium]
MLRKFNYTDRKRIPRTKVSFTIIPSPKGPPSFDASIDLKGLKLPKHAGVYVEAYRRTFFRRFAFGTVSQIQPPKDRYLHDMDQYSLVRFRVKVVDTAGKGRILAVADRLQPRRTEEEPIDKLCLLPVDFTDLGHCVWRLDLESDWPSLILNNRVDNIREIARSDHSFFSLVYPELVRQILYKIVIEEDHTDPESDPDDWMSLWLSFSRDLLGINTLPPSGSSEPIIQEKMKWIEDIVEAFCSNNKVLERFIQVSSIGES